MSAKDLVLAPLTRAESNACVRAWHYSGRPYNKSVLHCGAFLDGRLCGVLAWGPGVDTRNLIGLIAGTPWDGYLELNRMAFSPALPRNSESRALALCVRMMRRHAPWLRWLISFADGAQSGGGTIYRAAGWILTQARENTTLWRTASGAVVSTVGVRTSTRLRMELGGRDLRRAGCSRLVGQMRRYMMPMCDEAATAIAAMRIDYADTMQDGSAAPPPRAFDSTCPLYVPAQTGDRPTMQEAIASMPRYTDPMGATGRSARRAAVAQRAAGLLL